MSLSPDVFSLKENPIDQEKCLNPDPNQSFKRCVLGIFLDRFKATNEDLCRPTSCKVLSPQTQPPMGKLVPLKKKLENAKKSSKLIQDEKAETGNVCYL